MKKHFFSNGICFECQKCGICCTGSSGIVKISDFEAEKISAFLEISLNEFINNFITIKRNIRTLKEKDNYDCIFFKKELGCKIYPVRPIQCTTFPFWPNNLRSKKKWEQISDKCIGIGKGKLHKEKEILEEISKQLNHFPDIQY